MVELVPFKHKVEGSIPSRLMYYEQTRRIVNTKITIPFILYLAAIGCFIVGLLYALNVLHDTDNQLWEWGFGGFISFAAGHLPWTT